MDTTEEFLQSFPNENSYSRDALVTLIQNTDWGSPEAISTLQNRLRKQVEIAIRAWTQLPKRLGCSPLTTVRNLIACAQESDLVVYSILLRYEAKISLSSLGEHLAEIIDLLPSTDPELSLLKILVLTDKKPSIGAYSRVLRFNPEQLFFARFWAIIDSGAVSTEVLADAFLKVVKGPLRHHGDPCVLTMQKLLKKYKWHPFVDRPYLEQLPTSTRRSALKNGGLLTPKLRKFLKEEPYFHPDAPAVLVRNSTLSSALWNIGQKDLSKVVIAQLAEDAVNFTANAKKIGAKVRYEPLYGDKPKLGTPRLKRALRKLVELPEALALLTLCFMPSQRHRVLVASPKYIASEAIALLPIKEVAKVLAETKTSVARAHLLDILDDEKIRYRVLKQCFLDQYFKRPVGYRNLLVEWFQIASAKELVRTVRLDDSVMQVFADTSNGNRKFIDLLSTTLKRLHPTVILQLLTPAHRDRYRITDAEQADELVQAMIERLCTKKSVNEWSNPKTLPVFVRWFPQAALLVLEKCRVDWAFRVVCGAPKVWRLGDEVVDRLMRLKDSQRNLLWKRFLQRWSQKDRPVPSALRRYIEKRPELLDQAFDRAPTVFWKFVRSRYPLRRLLEMAFRYPKLAVDLERRVSRDRLRGEIPWVRENWKDKPTIAAAYEVSAAFSLPDAGFIVSLGKRLRPPFDPALRGTAFDNLYRTYDLPKKSGGNRIITVPSDLLKRFQRRLLDQGFDEITLHPAAMGFVRGRSIRDNAEQHVGKKLVANVDIHKFFPNTRYELILRASRKLCDGEISPRAARLVAEICSYNGALPTGAPTSPAIANCVLNVADKAISTVTERVGVTYTRYADDLTFSGDDSVMAILPFVRDVLAELGFQLDDKKTNLYRRGRRQIVTGLVVNEKPNIPRRVRRKLRAAVHRRLSGGEPHWHNKPMSDNVLLGHIAFLYLTQPDESARYRLCLREVLMK